MPLDLDPAVEAAIDSGHYKKLEALDVVFKDGTTRHLCEDAVPNVTTEEFGIVSYTKDLRDVGTLTESLTLAADVLEFSVQNVDGVIGQQALGPPRALNGARGIYSNIFVIDGSPYRVMLIGGMIQNAEAGKPDGRFKLYGDLSQPGPIFARRPAQQHCTIPKFGGPGCSSPSADGVLQCTRKKDGAGGCADHDAAPQLTTPVPDSSKGNTDRFQGYEERKESISGATIGDPGGTVDRDSDFNSFLRERGGDWGGRFVIP